MAKKVHETVFEIAAKLAGSFNSVFGQAQSKLQGLGKTAAAIGKRFQQVTKWILGIGAAAVAAFAAFGIGNILRKAFGGAQEAARNYLATTAQIGTIMQANLARHKIGPEIARQQTEELMRQTGELGKIGVLGGSAYNEAIKTLATYQQSPKAIGQLLPVMGDVLVATKGINASTEDMAAFSTAVGKAIQGGPVKALGQYNLDLTKINAKQWKQMSVQQRINELTKQWGALSGANAKAAEEDLGAMKRFDNAIGGFSKRLGLEMIPAQAEWARFWTEQLPMIEGIVLPIFARIMGAMKDFASFLRSDLMPTLKQDFEGAFGAGGAWERLGDAWNRLSGIVGPPLSDFFRKLLPEGKSLSDVINDVLIAAFEDLADTLESIADAITWVSDIENMRGAFQKLGEAIQNVPILKEVLPPDYGARVAKDLETEWKGIGKFLTDPVGTAKGEWQTFQTETQSGFDKIKEKLVGARDALKNFLATKIEIPAVDLLKAFGLDKLQEGWAKFKADFQWPALPPFQWPALPPFQWPALPPFQWPKIELPTIDWSGIVEAIKKWFQDAWDGAKQIWSDVSGIFADTASQVGAALAAVGEALKKPFIDAIAEIKKAWDALITAITSFDIGALAKGAWEKVKSLGRGAPAPTAAPTQFGGIFSSPSVRQIAEAGPEAVIPLRRSGRSEGLLSAAAGALGMGVAGRGGTNVGPTSMSFAPVITVNGALGGSERMALDQQLRRLADDFMRQFSEFQAEERRLAYE